MRFWRLPLARGLRDAAAMASHRALLLAVVMIPTTTAAAPVGERFAFGVSEPFAWQKGVFAISVEAAIADHHAVRVNVARYPTLGALATDLISCLNSECNDATGQHGGYLDIGAGWQWFPRSLWSGPTVEAGLLWRLEHTHTDDYPMAVDRDATVIATRGLVGWSWLFEGRVLVMAGVGAAVGYRRGADTTFDEYGGGPGMRRAAPSLAFSPEGYLRFGWSF